MKNNKDNDTGNDYDNHNISLFHSLQNAIDFISTVGN